MEINVNKFGAIIIVSALTMGCVKVQLLPEDAVKNTWKAGKNMYDDRKLKKDGGEKRDYSSQVVISDYPSRADAEISCIAPLKERLKAESTEKEPVVTSEKAFIVDGLDNNVIECQVTGFVWPTIQ